jgi:hypothetical protein
MGAVQQGLQGQADCAQEGGQWEQDFTEITVNGDNQNDDGITWENGEQVFPEVIRCNVSSGTNSGTTSIVTGNVTTNLPTIALGALVGGWTGGPVGGFVGGILGSLFGVGGTASYVPSSKSLYAGPTVVFAPALGGGNGFSGTVSSVPASQNPDSIASSWDYSITFQPSPLLGSTVTKSPGSGPPVVGPSVGTRVPVSFAVSYSFAVVKGGC